MKRLRLGGMLLAVATTVLVLAGCQSGPLGSSGSEDSSASLPATELGFVEPGAQLSCFWGDYCLGPPEEGSWNPMAVAQAVEALIDLIKSDGGTSQCVADGGRQELRCLQSQAKKSGVVVPTTPRPSPTPGGSTPEEPAMKAIVSPSASTMPGSPVKAQTLLRIYNTGNEPLTVTADIEVVRMGACPAWAGAVAPSDTVAGIEVSPDSAGPVVVPPGVVLSQPLAIGVEETVAIGQYEICATTDGKGVTDTAQTVGSNAIAKLNVVNVPLRIDQSDMPADVVPGTPDVEGKIAITNLSPATYTGVTVLQQFTPGSDVVIKKASLEDGTCTVNAPNSNVTCVLPSIDKFDSKDLNLTFDSNPTWAGKLASSVTVTVIGNPGSVSVKTIGEATSPSAGTYPVGPSIAASGDTHLTGPNLLTYQGRYLYLVPGTGVLQLRDSATNAVVWSPNPGSAGGEDVWAQMQIDGNFVVYGEPNPPYGATPLWATGTGGGSDTVVAALGTAYTPDGATAIDSGVNFYVFNVTNGTVLYDSAGTTVPFAALIK